jgi:predicted DNA-binding transcriptional regulator AlpA
MVVNSEDNHEIITTAELCQWLGISQWIAYRWRKEGMPYLQRGRIVRYVKGKVQEWVKKSRNNKNGSEANEANT